MTIFSRTPRPREVSVHVSVHRDGYRSVSIHGGSLAEVGALMDAALRHPNVTATGFPSFPPVPLPAAQSTALPWYEDKPPTDR